MKLRYKAALVTGGSAGIGEAIAMRFASEGAKVAVIASAEIGKAESVVSKIVDANGMAEAFVAEIAVIEAMVETIVDAFGRVDVLINSAGIIHPTPAGTTSQTDYHRIMDINLKGIFFCINAVVPLMKSQGSGNIINISSTGSMMGLSEHSVCSASKASVIYLTKSLACELAPHGIRINAIAPGSTATPGNEDLCTNPEFKEHIDCISACTASGRAFWDTDDIARGAVFLASEDERAIHGSVLVLDEGFTLRI